MWLLTCGTIIFELFLASSIFFSKRGQALMLKLGLCFHFLIMIFLGLGSFFFAMAGCLVFYLGNNSMNLENYKRWLKMLIYFEEQKFSQRWLKIILYAAFIICLSVPLLSGSAGSFNLLTFIPAIFLLAIIFFFRQMKLTLILDANNVAYKFRPFHKKNQTIKRRDIKNIAVVTYDPIGDFGGWGIRFGKNAKAYSVRGPYGLEITLNSGKSILIGTTNPEKLSSFLRGKGSSQLSK